MKYWQLDERYGNLIDMMLVIGFCLFMKGCQTEFGMPDFLQKTHSEPVLCAPANGGTETPSNRGIQKPESVLEP